MAAIEAKINFGYIISGMVFISSWVFFYYKVMNDSKKERKKQDETFAKKQDVDKDFNAMDRRISMVERVTEKNRIENLAAHREIKEEIKEHINVRFDDLKDLIKSIGKSA